MSLDGDYEAKLIEFNLRPYWIRDTKTLFEVARSYGTLPLLDYGCGLGVSQKLREVKNTHVVGLEPRHKLHENSYYDVVLDREALLDRMTSENRFGSVVLNHSIAHVNEVELFDTLDRVMKEKHAVAVVTPNPLFYEEAVRRGRMTIEQANGDTTVINDMTVSHLYRMFSNRGYSMQVLQMLGESSHAQFLTQFNARILAVFVKE